MCHVGVSLISSDFSVWLCLLAYLAKNLDRVTYRNQKKNESGEEFAEWRKGAMLSAIGAAQGLLGHSILSECECGKLKVHLNRRRKKVEESSESNGSEDDDEEEEEGEFSGYSKLELYFVRPKELCHIRSLQYHEEYVVSTTDPTVKRGGKEAKVYRDRSFQKQYVYKRLRARQKWVRWEVPSILQKDVFLWCLLSTAHLDLPCISEEEEGFGRAYQLFK